MRPDGNLIIGPVHGPNRPIIGPLFLLCIGNLLYPYRNRNARYIAGVWSIADLNKWITNIMRRSP